MSKNKKQAAIDSDYSPHDPRFRGNGIPRMDPLVERVLIEHPPARNDDAVLHRRVELLVLEGKVSTTSTVEEFFVAAESTKLPSRYTTSKHRRAFQARGKYLPTDPLIAKRRSSSREAQYRRHQRGTRSGR